MESDYSTSFSTPCLIKTTEEGDLIVEDQEGHEIEIRGGGSSGGHTTKFMLQIN
jgi:hypothetical protein